MHARTLAGLSLAVLAGAAGLAARAADGAPATGTTYTNRDLGATPSASSAPLYTNADLDKFGPPEPTTAPRRETARTDDTAAWAFVQAALDREAARLEEERRYALEIEATRAMAAAEGHEACSGGTGYLSAPFVGFGLGRRPFRDRVIFRDPHDPGPFVVSPSGSRDTIHGRPPATQTQHGRYSHLRGADAVPRGYFQDSPASRGGHGKSGGANGRGRGHSGHR